MYALLQATSKLYPCYQNYSSQCMVGECQVVILSVFFQLVSANSAQYCCSRILANDWKRRLNDNIIVIMDSDINIIRITNISQYLSIGCSYSHGITRVTTQLRISGIHKNWSPQGKFLFIVGKRIKSCAWWDGGVWNVKEPHPLLMNPVCGILISSIAMHHCQS